MDYDYIVVGGGSSGCVTAGRLVKDHGARVLMLEAGPDNNNPLVGMPAGFIKLLGVEKYTWLYRSAQQPRLNGRAPFVFQGRVIGGGSSVNAMIYIRGQATDYDPWERASGYAGWGYRNLLPHFRRIEGNQRLNNALHGIEGPMKVSDPAYVCAASHAFVRAAQGAGLRYNPDFNGGRQTGVGYFQTTTFAGRRVSAADAYLDPVRADPKLTLVTGCLVTRVTIEGGRAVGVEYVKGGDTVKARAANEVILCAGAIATPKLLMLSGIGPAEDLRRHGVEVRVDLPGVGQNLQDHHEVPVLAFTRGAYGYYGEDVGWRKWRNGLQYMLFKSGPVASNGVEAGAFFDPDDLENDAAIQLFCVPSIFLDKDVTGVSPSHGITLNACLLRPKSRGSVRLASADPKDQPILDPNYFADPDDLRVTLGGLRFAREIMAREPLRGMIDRELFPGAEATADAELEAHSKRFVKTVWHPVGTCRMGADDDPMAVLTPDLRVRGVEGLRVFDASMMPTIVSGNTNSTTMAVADKAVGLMMGEVGLQPIDLPNDLAQAA